MKWMNWELFIRLVLERLKELLQEMVQDRIHSLFRTGMTGKDSA